VVTAAADRVLDRVSDIPYAGAFVADRTEEEERRTAPASRALAVRVVRTGVIAAIVAAVSQSIIYLFSAAFLGNSWVFNVDIDAGVFTWASATVTAFAALALAVLSLVRPHHRWLNALAALVILYLSLDDQIAIHERIGTYLEDHVVQSVSGILWEIAYIPLLLFPFLTFAWIASNVVTRPERRAIGLGLGLLVGALFAEAIHGVIGALQSAANFRYYAEVTIEEGMELAAWIVLASVTMSLLLRAVSDQASPSDRGQAPGATGQSEIRLDPLRSGRAETGS
jgi:hypothetical protein